MVFTNPKRKLIKNPKEQPRNKPLPQAGFAITSASVSGSVLTLTFDVPVNVVAVPKITTDVAGAVAVSAVATNLQTVEVTFDNDISAATSVNLDYQDPAIRSNGGGFVFSPSFPIAA
jgi:hypothetical protein